MEKSKNTFGSKLGFILAAAGSAIGLGNIWRFPGLVATYGGGAFVLVYILSVILLGSVVMIAEMFLGRRTKTNVVDSYGKANKYLKWVGFLGVLVPFVISSYYAVIGGWSAGYAIEYLFNTDLMSPTVGGVFDSTLNNGQGGWKQLPFFFNFIGAAGDGNIIAVLFFILFLLATLLIVSGGVQKGIEKANKLMMPALFVLIIAVIIYGLTLPGTGKEGETVVDGLKFYLGQFNFQKLGWNGVLAAMGQAFYSLSLGMGVMIAYGAYTGKNTNLGKSALTVCFLDTLVALLAGFAIFPAMFATGIEHMMDYAGAGPKLLFVAMSQVFSNMGPGGNILGFLFFTFVVFAALTSLMSLIEVVSQYTIDKYNMPRKKATMVFGSLIGLLGLFVALQYVRNYTIFGFEMLDYLDMVTNQVLMPIIAFMACITVGYVLKPKKVFKELEEMGSSFKGQKFWMALNMSVTPALVMLVWVMGLVDNFKAFGTPAQHYGWVLGGSMLVLVLAVVWNLMSENKKYQNWKKNKKEKEEAAVAEYTADEENEAVCETEACVETSAVATCECGCDNCNNNATKGAD